MKKILLSILTIGLVISVVVGVSRAYFSDTETSTDNTFTAGTLDLDIDGGDTAVTTMTLTGKAPGDSGTEESTLKNSGSLGGELDIAIGTVSDYACNPDGANDGTEYCDLNADLGSNAKLTLYLDIDKDGSWSTGDIGFKSDGTSYNYPTALDYDVVNNYSGVTWNDVYSGLMASMAEDDFVIAWKIESAVGNLIQGDKVEFDITFTLEQASKD